MDGLTLTSKKRKIKIVLETSVVNVRLQLQQERRWVNYTRQRKERKKPTFQDGPMQGGATTRRRM
jgi:hypothetical protein